MQCKLNAGTQRVERFAAESSRGDYPVFEMQSGSDSAETTVLDLEFGISDLEFMYKASNEFL